MDWRASVAEQDEDLDLEFLGETGPTLTSGDPALTPLLATISDVPAPEPEASSTPSRLHHSASGGSPTPSKDRASLPPPPPAKEKRGTGSSPKGPASKKARSSEPEGDKGKGKAPEQGLPGKLSRSPSSILGLKKSECRGFVADFPTRQDDLVLKGVTNLRIRESICQHLLQVLFLH